MHPNALLDLTTELLRSVLKLDAPADGLVSQFFRKHRDLGARENRAYRTGAAAYILVGSAAPSSRGTSWVKTRPPAVRRATSTPRSSACR
jgi:5,10-methylenetetrahydrofolate reductase